MKTAKLSTTVQRNLNIVQQSAGTKYLDGNGRVREIPEDLRVGVVHSSSNDGEFVISKYENSHNIQITFIDTEYKTHKQASDIRRGCIKDRLRPSVCGVGFIGVGEFKSDINGAPTDEYAAWSKMIHRCYDPKVHEKQPTYKDCTVSPEWHNFQNFAKWYEDNYPKDGKSYHLDKDIKFMGNKIYSKETCIFATPKENSVASAAKSWRLKSPEGEVFEVYNLSDFCSSVGIDVSNMGSVLRGKRKSHKGWTKP